MSDVHVQDDPADLLRGSYVNAQTDHPCARRGSLPAREVRIVSQFVGDGSCQESHDQVGKRVQPHRDAPKDQKLENNVTT